MLSWHRIRKIQAVYAKYGASPSQAAGSVYADPDAYSVCLYRVIYAIPAYVGRVKEAFFPSGR